MTDFINAGILYFYEVVFFVFQSKIKMPYAQQLQTTRICPEKVAGIFTILNFEYSCIVHLDFGRGSTPFDNSGF